jgi:hypothetical protein
MAEKWHPGISMHKLPVSGGFVGLLFAAGSALIFVLGFPTLWYFVALAALLGIVVALCLRAMSSWRSNRSKPLSITTVLEPTPVAPAAKRDDRPHHTHNLSRSKLLFARPNSVLG